MMKPWRITVHCTDSDNPAHDNFKTLWKWHVEENGWSHIGYHILIHSSGKWTKCRPILRTGAHVKNQNEGNIGIALHGRTKFTKAQRVTLVSLIRDLMKQYGVGVNNVYGHYEFDPKKTCPNFPIGPLRREIMSEVKEKDLQKELEEKFGIEKIEKLFSAVERLAKNLAKELGDGFSPDDLVKILLPLLTDPDLQAVFKDLKGVGDEFKDLDRAEIFKLVLLILSLIEGVFSELIRQEEQAE